MSIKKWISQAFKLIFYSVWFFILSFFIIAFIVLFSNPRDAIGLFLISVLLNIPFIFIWRKYYYFSFSDVSAKCLQLVKELIEFGKGLLYLALIITILVVIWYVAKGGFNTIKNMFKNNDWTFMVCETMMGNGVECYDNSYSIPGFKSQKECMLEGARNFSKEGFECGKGCEESEYGLKVCDVVCNKAGCTD